MSLQRIGPNVLQDSRIEPFKLRHVLDITKPTVFHTVNRYELAQLALEALDDDAVVIYRATSKDDPDESQHRRYNAQAWIDKFARGKDERMFISCLNEPDGGYTEEARDFVLECMHIGRQLGVRLVVYNFNPGQPHEQHVIGAGLLDELYRQLADGYHILGTHSYANTREMLLSSPWLVGRDYFHIERAKQIGVTPPRIIVTEMGYAQLNGKGRKGWKSWEYMSGKEYAEHLITLDTARHSFVNGKIFTSGYADMPEVEGYCLFGYGDSGGWAEDDVRLAGDLWQTIANYAQSGNAPLPRYHGAIAPEPAPPAPAPVPTPQPPSTPAPVPVPVPPAPGQPDSPSPDLLWQLSKHFEDAGRALLALAGDYKRLAEWLNE